MESNILFSYFILMWYSWKENARKRSFKEKYMGEYSFVWLKYYFKIKWNQTLMILLEHLIILEANRDQREEIIKLSQVTVF